MAVNALFKADDYISVNVGLEKSSGDPFVVGELVGVCTTGSGSATIPTPDAKRNGVGNKPGFASVALTGGFRVPVAAGTAYAVGDVVTINTSTAAISKTAVSATQIRFGIVTHEPKTAPNAGFIVVKIGA
jgi:hypothetical protein